MARLEEVETEMSEVAQRMADNLGRRLTVINLQTEQTLQQEGILQVCSHH